MKIVKGNPSLRLAFNSLTDRFIMIADVDSTGDLCRSIIDTENPIKIRVLWFFSKTVPRIVATAEEKYFSIEYGYFSEIIPLLKQAERLSGEEVTIAV